MQRDPGHADRQIRGWIEDFAEKVRPARIRIADES